ncbi:hypothetical protein BDD12DRAFT_23130 [Trichophaea hybrida]|nr:hypothetical protein BDD12DRAFT_23130 [Trichophaea hybrida]
MQWFQFAGSWSLMVDVLLHGETPLLALTCVSVRQVLMCKYFWEGETGHSSAYDVLYYAVCILFEYCSCRVLLVGGTRDSTCTYRQAIFSSRMFTLLFRCIHPRARPRGRTGLTNMAFQVDHSDVCFRFLLGGSTGLDAALVCCGERQSRKKSCRRMTQINKQNAR